MANNRLAILDAAIAAIARRGIRGLRVEEVAERAGVAVSLLYYHFKSRDGLIGAALERSLELLRSRDLQAAEALNGYERAEQLLLADLEPDLVQESSIVWGEALASAVFEPSLREQLGQAYDAWTELIVERIRDGQQDSSIDGRVDPETCAELITAAVDGISNRWNAGLLDLGRARELLIVATHQLLKLQPADIGRGLVVERT
jgi:AcrR family transcriptional regulator